MFAQKPLFPLFPANKLKVFYYFRRWRFFRELICRFQHDLTFFVSVGTRIEKDQDGGKEDKSESVTFNFRFNSLRTNDTFDFDFDYINIKFAIRNDQNESPGIVWQPCILL